MHVLPGLSDMAAAAVRAVTAPAMTQGTRAIARRLVGMTLWTTILSVLAGLLLAPGSVPALAAPDSARFAAVVEPVTMLEVAREYGDGPVAVSASTDKVRIRFHARKGDRVRLFGARLCPLVLRGPSGVEVARDLSGFWRVRERGLQTMHFRRCARATHELSLQLAKLEVRRVTVNGPPTPLPGRVGYIRAVRVTVPTSGRLQVMTPWRVAPTPPSFTSVIVAGRRYRLADWPEYYGSDVGKRYLFLEAEHRIEAADSRAAQDLMVRPLARDARIEPVTMPVLHASERVLVLTGDPPGVEPVRGVRVWASTTQAVPVVVDGDPVVLTAGELPYREFQLDYWGTAGTWLHLEMVGSLGGVAPAGAWYVPVTGPARVLVRAGFDAATASVRLRTVRRLADPLPVDGTPVTFEALEPGQWVIGGTAGGYPGYFELRASSSTLVEGWQGLARMPIYPSGPFDPGCNGCGEFQSGLVDAQQPLSPVFGGSSGPWLVVLSVPPGQLGRVDLALTPANSP